MTKSGNKKCFKNMEKLKPSCTAGGIVKLTVTLENNLVVFRMIKHSNSTPTYMHKRNET